MERSEIRGSLSVVHILPALRFAPCGLRMGLAGFLHNLTARGAGVRSRKRQIPLSCQRVEAAILHSYSFCAVSRTHPARPIPVQGATPCPPESITCCDVVVGTLRFAHPTDSPHAPFLLRVAKAFMVCRSPRRAPLVSNTLGWPRGDDGAREIHEVKTKVRSSVDSVLTATRCASVAGA
jgi:hypothetical protein